MNEKLPGEKVQTNPGRQAAFWVTLARAVLATALGLAIIVYPDKTRPLLVNFIGMFWLVGGIMNLRWSMTGERARRTSVAAGLIGILAGLLVLGRFLISGLVHETAVVLLLGGVIVLTGLVHVFEGFLVGAGRERQRSWLSTLLGILEILLGVAVLVWRQNFGPVFYGVVTVWAFLGAVVLLREALVKRSVARQA